MRAWLALHLSSSIDTISASRLASLKSPLAKASVPLSRAAFRCCVMAICRALSRTPCTPRSLTRSSEALRAVTSRKFGSTCGDSTKSIRSLHSARSRRQGGFYRYNHSPFAVRGERIGASRGEIKVGGTGGRLASINAQMLCGRVRDTREQLSHYLQVVEDMVPRHFHAIQRIEPRQYQCWNRRFGQVKHVASHGIHHCGLFCASASPATISPQIVRGEVVAGCLVVSAFADDNATKELTDVDVFYFVVVVCVPLLQQTQPWHDAEKRRGPTGM